jgi:hypothetical protein
LYAQPYAISASGWKKTDAFRGTSYIDSKCRKGKKGKSQLAPVFFFTFIPSFFFLNSRLYSRTWTVRLPPTTVLRFFFSPREVPSLCSRREQLSSSSTPRRRGRCPRGRHSSSSRRARRRTRLRSRPRTRRTLASWRGARWKIAA